MKRRNFKNQLIDFKYTGHFLGGNLKTRFKDLGAHNTEHTGYGILDHILTRVSADDVFVDIGCGKGRVISWLIGHGYKNTIIGIELDEKVAGASGKVFRKFNNVNIISGDVLKTLPSNGTFFYMFNPFDEMVMKKFANLLIENWDKKIRSELFITIVFASKCFCKKRDLP
jgi:16S rRNA A1518/A1519 N6-dimethyltransferase RsmA/KsgA/DIM1 with predicted DNA glycosylase/AP lyase activity